ncbi:MAG: PrsW family glutamic-type intramembrane protease [Faecalibacterium sp.]|nr:PrsW family glutamic-type intramembrane protease [Faecalibacterium sp.]
MKKNEGELMQWVLFAAAVIPPAILMIYIYKKDKVDKEPTGLLLRLLLAGALSVVSAIILESVGMALAGLVAESGSALYNALTCFLVIATAEEGGKLYFLKRRTWHNRNFTSTFDGIVYAVFVSAGFAIVENIMYVFTNGTIYVALLRGVTAIPGHINFAVFMGYFYGLAKRSVLFGEFEKANRYKKLAFWVPVLLHGLYDFCLQMNSTVFTVIFTVFVVVMDVFVIVKVRKWSKDDKTFAADIAESYDGSDPFDLN